jgi:autotransporter-associated beta strand protein
VTPRLLIFTALLLVAIHVARAQVPAFPGAEGFGAYATGGRGGDVYIVTNLNSSGAGSLYEGVTTIPAAGRTIVFEVAGQIHLAGGIATRITSNKLTIAGQTAPGDGILLKDGTLRISGDDIVIRHLRFRHGKYGSGGDCIDLDSGCQNAILDHISMSFSTDENISSYSSPPENLTMQWSLNAWGLETHSCGGLWDQNHATCHHSVWAHNHTRNPKARPNGLLEWTNNVSFDWDIGFIMGDSYTPSSWKANVRGSYFICPPANIKTYALEKGWLDRNATRLPTFSIYLDNNLMDRDGDGLLNGAAMGYERVQGREFDPAEVVDSYATNPDVPRYYKNATPFAGSSLLTLDPPLLAYKKIVSSAGAQRLDYAYAGTLRDEVDTRLFNNLVTQAANHITRESDLTGVSNSGFGTFAAATAPIDSDRDGMPDSYENALGWNAAVQDHNTTVSGTTFFPAGYSSSYTRLEEYLYFKSIPHMMLVKSTATSPDIDLTRYTAGFSNAPVLTIANITGGTVTQSGTGGKLVHFTAQASAGRGGFDFTVTDADGSTWTQRFAVCVVNSGAPSDLTWKGNGTSTADWDTTTSNWLKAGAPTTFSAGDRVTFDATGATSATVNLPGSVTAATIDVNAASSFALTGAGSASATNALSKRGTGTLTIGNATANSFGSVSLEQGTLAVNTAGGVSSATITCSGGALSLGPAANSTIAAPLTFLAPTTITPTTQHTESGNWTGTNQTVTMSGGAVLWTVAGTWTGFTGRIQFGSSSAKIRLNNTTSANFGSTAVAIDLGSNNAQIMNRNGATISFGSLESTGANTQLLGTQTGTTASTYSIGALNTDTTFAGIIANGGAGGVTSITKVGTGTWTLTGASTHTGTTLVNAGAMIVNGSFGASPVSVSSGATLGGSGTLGALVSTASGATIAPVGTLTASAGLTLAGTNTLNFDLSNSTSSGNDKITVSSGTLTLSSATLNFTINLLNGALANGTYALIDGVATMAVNPAPALNLVGLPSDARQSFTLQRATNGSTPAFVNLIVGGTPPAALVWSGSGGSAWDLNSTSNFTGGPTATFFNFDTVTFDDTSSVGAIALGGTLQPKALVVNNATRAYTWNGSGVIAGGASVTKSGASSLTITPTMLSISTTTNATNQATVSTADAATLGVGMAVIGGGLPLGAFITAIDTATGVIAFSQASTTSTTATLSYQSRNSFTGGTTISGGSIVLTNEAANRWGLGTGAVTFNGGTLTLAGVTGSNGVDTGTFPNDLVVPAGQTGTLNTMQRGRLTGALTGNGTLNVLVKYVRGDFYGDWSAFTGQLNITAASGSEFRMAESYTPNGFPNCAVNLGANVTFKLTGNISGGSGTTIDIGELSGVAASIVQGGYNAGRALTYRIGGKNTTATFAGNIAEQTPGSTLTNIVKTGNGTWTISGTNSWAGGTTVEQGILAVSGNTTSTGAVTVQSGATLRLENGTLTTDAVNLADGATLSGNGTVAADLNISGSAIVSSTTGGTLTVAGTIVNNGTLRIAGNTTLSATGSLTNNGVLDLLTSPSSLPANFVNNGVVIENTKRTITSASKSGNDFICVVMGYTGHAYQLQMSATLTDGWSNVGSAAAGTGIPIEWTVTNGGTGMSKFYRVLISP